MMAYITMAFFTMAFFIIMLISITFCYLMHHIEDQCQHCSKIDSSVDKLVLTVQKIHKYSMEYSKCSETSNFLRSNILKQT